ncbi:hypothetical protein N752_11455 [Desulforamulus aquiferis]|nr:zinc ribbon domain-containing protein [Desulforamulus aquiferis]RYD04973.1 hypothetical protein N752_11455 [Desulforamulus aquiferis]
MPIFEFVCKSCNKPFEKLLLAGRETKVTCPVCSCDEVEKKISAPFLPSSVGRPANDCTTPSCTGGSKEGGCQPGG